MSKYNSKSYHYNYHGFKSINEFEIIKDLGKGGYSVVKLVRHIRSGEKYALKCANKYKKGKNISKRTRNEINVLSSLSEDPKIVKLYGWFEDEDHIYLVLEYLAGKDLSKFFRRRLPTREDAKDIFLQIVDAIQYCHNQSVIHRDIKLENILINRELNIKLTDFGLSIIREHDGYFYEEVGTARYTAPELIRKKGYDEGIDVWGLGIILFMLLTGKYPFDGRDREHIFRRIKRKTINYNRYDLSKAEIHLLKRLLCKDPRYRIQLEDIKYHKWLQPDTDPDDSDNYDNSNDSIGNDASDKYKHVCDSSCYVNCPYKAGHICDRNCCGWSSETTS
jgi:serine/threonine protein kinase